MLKICTSSGEGAELGPHLGGDREQVSAVAGGRRGLQDGPLWAGDATLLPGRGEGWRLPSLGLSLDTSDWSGQGWVAFPS